MCDGLLAYLDPGAGSILLQLVMGSIVGVILVFRRTLTRVAGWIGIGRQSEDSTTNPSGENR